MNANLTSAAAATMLIEFTPPLIQTDLLADATFRSAYGFDSGVFLTLTDEVAFQRSVLYGAIREALSGLLSIQVIDTANHKWQVMSELSSDNSLTLFLAGGKRRLVIPQYRLLSPDPSARILVLDELADENRLPTRDRWLKVVTERSPTDNEMDEFDDDLHDTPAYNARVVREALASGRFQIASAVPTRTRYYRRIIGRYDGATSFTIHCGKHAVSTLRNLRTWRLQDEILQAVTLSCSGATAGLIDTESLDASSISKLFSQLDTHGDKLSQTGAVELGLRVLPKFPQVEPHLLSMIKQIRDDDHNREASDYRLIAGLYRAIDGELAMRRTLSFGRPYYRRFAALAQSTIVAREVSVGRINKAGFSDWLSEIPDTWFFLQNYVDMRIEPRWSPLSFDSQALKSACIGRIFSAADEFAESIHSEELRDMFLDGGKESLFEQFKRSVVCLPEYPGPLSAATGSLGRMRDELRTEVEHTVGAGAVDRSSLALFSTTATMFYVGEELAVQVAKNLKANRHRISEIEDASQLFDIVMRLAVAAAVCRSEALADELGIIARMDRSSNGLFRNVHKSMNICLSSAASRPKLQDWARYVGDWLTELSFLDISDEDAGALASSLRCLMELVPELWKTCARADAALQALIGR